MMLKAMGRDRGQPVRDWPLSSRAKGLRAELSFTKAEANALTARQCSSSSSASQPGAEGFLAGRACDDEAVQTLGLSC